MTGQSKPILYLLKHDFLDPKAGAGPFYCPYCMRIEGLLAAFPILKRYLTLCYVDFPKPRGALAEWVGEASESCPQIILPDGDDEVSHEWSIAAAQGARRIENTDHIEKYLVARFDLPCRHP